MSFFFDVPYKDKELAKKMGARWNQDAKRWHTTNPTVRMELLKKWKEISGPQSEPAKRDGWELDNKFSNFFNVPIDKGTFAQKSLGAKFDVESWRWFAPNEAVWNQLIPYFEQSLEAGEPLNDIDEYVPKRKNYQKDTFASWEFDVPYTEKDFAKQINAVWNNDKKTWSAPNEQIWHFLIRYWKQKHSGPQQQQEQPEEEPKEETKQEMDTDESNEFLLDDDGTDFQKAKNLGAIYNPDTNMWSAPNRIVWEKMCDLWEPV